MIVNFPNLTKFTEHAIERLHVRSVLNSALWLALITSLFGLVGAIFSQPPIQYWMVGFMFLGPSLVVIGFGYFSFTDPRQLRSEEHDLRSRALGIIEEQGNPIPVNATTVEAIADMKYLPPPKKEAGENGK